MVRAPFYDKNGVKKGAWNAEEDDKLRSYIERFGHWNWRELPKHAGNICFQISYFPRCDFVGFSSGLERCGKSCRLRWMNYLRPDVKHRNFTEEEDDLILKLHEEYGNRWSMIAASLPGRTDNEIKNQWHSRLKARAIQDPTSSADHSRGESLSARGIELAEAGSIHIVIPPNMILESSALTRTTKAAASTVELSPARPVSDNGYTSSLNVGDGGTEDVCPPWCSSATYEDGSSGDFWSEPFVTEKDLPLHHEIYDDDDNVDLVFHQTMHEWEYLDC